MRKIQKNKNREEIEIGWKEEIQKEKIEDTKKKDRAKTIENIEAIQMETNNNKCCRAREETIISYRRGKKQRQERRNRDREETDIEKRKKQKQ